MGEIKSTLDLVMEKTRHLTLSREERDARQEEETRKTLRGLIQKYRDQLLREEQFLEELWKLKTGHVREMLAKEILARIEIEKENEQFLKLLEFACGLEVENLKVILTGFSARRDALIAGLSREAKNRLKKDSEISGSAVVPNLEADAGLNEGLMCLRQEYGIRLEEEKAGLTV